MTERAGRLDELKRFGASGAFDDLVAAPFQGVHEQAAAQVVVFDEQHSGRADFAHWRKNKGIRATGFSEEERFTQRHKDMARQSRNQRNLTADYTDIHR